MWRYSDTVRAMKTPLTYGVAMAIASALLTFVMFFAGFHDSPEKMQSGLARTISSVGPLAIAITCLALAMRDKRGTTPLDQTWGYGSALGTGVLTALVGAFVGAIFAYVYFAYINPNMADVVYQMQVAKMEANGTSADQIEKAEPMMRKFMSAPGMTLFQTFFGFLSGVVLSLIVAIFFRKRKIPLTEADLQVPPPLTS
jgi:hypothetical protein